MVLGVMTKMTPITLEQPQIEIPQDLALSPDLEERAVIAMNDRIPSREGGQAFVWFIDEYAVKSPRSDISKCNPCNKSFNCSIRTGHTCEKNFYEIQAESIISEARIARHLASNGIKAPEIYGVSEGVLGKLDPFMVMEKMDFTNYVGLSRPQQEKFRKMFEEQMLRVSSLGYFPLDTSLTHNCGLYNKTGEICFFDFTNWEEIKK